MQVYPFRNLLDRRSLPARHKESDLIEFWCQHCLSLLYVCVSFIVTAGARRWLNLPFNHGIFYCKSLQIARCFRHCYHLHGGCDGWSRIDCPLYSQVEATISSGMEAKNAVCTRAHSVLMSSFFLSLWPYPPSLQVLVTLSLATGALGLALMLIGRLKLASLVQYLPMPV